MFQTTNQMVPAVPTSHTRRARTSSDAQGSSKRYWSKNLRDVSGRCRDNLQVAALTRHAQQYLKEPKTFFQNQS